MAEKSCKVSVMDSDGNAHSCRVTASSVYEAAAQGLVAIQKSGWANIPFEPLNISVSVNEIPVEHEVRYLELLKWANRPGGRSPREISERIRIREILGIPEQRRA
jgi:hypothetical protein